jgi:hypothetical protein
MILKLCPIYFVTSALAVIAQTPPVPQPTLLNGRPFPLVARYAPQGHPVRHTFLVAPGKDSGNDLQRAICELAPGDLLRVRKGKYPELRIDGSCRDGSPANPIQVIFERDAAVQALTIRKSNWNLTGLETREGGLTIEASFVAVDNARVAGGLRMGAVREVTVSNCLISRANSVGIEIAAGAREIHLMNNRLHSNPSGSIRIDGASNVELVGNTIHDDRSTAIDVIKATRLRIVNNTLSDSSGLSSTHGIVLDEVDDAIVRSNHVSNYAVAISVGRSDEKEQSVRRANHITIDHNDLETATATGVALDIEAGNDIRFVNNVVERYADGILVLGRRETTKNVVVANNIVLGISRTAFVLRDPATATLFDYNIFSPTRQSIDIEVGDRTLALGSYIGRRTMRHTQQVLGVRIVNRDLARIEGVETVDRGKLVDGIAFQGRAPDLGVAER